MKPALLFIIFLLIYSVSTPASAEPVKVTFLPQWYHQAQFAGYYMAEKKGIYKKYGLEVTILEGSPDANVYDSLQNGSAVFTSQSLVSGLKKKALGLDIVCLSQILQKSSLMILGKKADGISKVSDLSGRSIGIWLCDFDVLIHEFIRKNRLSMTYVPVLSSVNIFLYGGIDTINALSYNEYHQIINSGFESSDLAVFDFNEFDLSFPEDGIYCLKNTFEQSREVCDKFVKASIEGWSCAFEHPEQAVDICLYYIRNMKGARQPASRAQETWMLNKLKELIQVGDVPVGNLSEEKYRLMGQLLLDQKVIAEVPLFNDFFKGSVNVQK
ncbi:MAG: ABC transporter substrate-binding protein [Candidatus Wallbacteria bacterium]|nr:ABC transporter substrate-binding protein [Candidatus Wallbacteria bacterium]